MYTCIHDRHPHIYAVLENSLTLVISLALTLTLILILAFYVLIVTLTNSTTYYKLDPSAPPGAAGRSLHMEDVAVQSSKGLESVSIGLLSV